MSIGFKIYSFLNGKLVHQDSLGNKFYHDKSNSNKKKVKNKILINQSINGYKKGNDPNASHWKSNHAPLRNEIFQKLSDKGYKRVLKRK